MCLLCTRHATARAKARKAARQRRLRRRLVGLNLRNGGEAPTDFFFPTYHTSLLEKTSYHTSLSTN